MKEHGYQVEHIPKNGDELIKTIMDRKAISDFRWTTAKEIVHKGGVLCQVTKKICIWNGLMNFRRKRKQYD